MRSNGHTKLLQTRHEMKFDNLDLGRKRCGVEDRLSTLFRNFEDAIKAKLRILLEG